MKKLTAITVFQTSAGARMSMVYSEINDSGVIVKDNARTDRILVDEEALGHAEALMEFAQACVDGLGV